MELSTLPDRHGEPWTETEDAMLLRDFKRGQSLHHLAATRKRTVVSIQCRLEHLGEFDFTKYNRNFFFEPSMKIAGSTFPLAEGEVYAGLSRDPETGVWHHVVLLPALPDKDLKWQEAIDWARNVGGELPTRWESALLYANCRQTIDTDYWYWTASPYAGDKRYAWNQNFNDGNQNDYHKDLTYRARAVRRVHVPSSPTDHLAPFPV